MWKKLVSLIIILALCVSVVWFTNPLTPVVASAEDYKRGLLITPEKEDETGVSLDSGFILSSETELNLEFVRNNVSIRDDVLLNISQLSDQKYLIKPTEPLKPNKVYYIDVKTENDDIITFAFQTKRDFAVLGTLPANTSNYVPLDTGIELYFSYPDVKDIESYFEISPKVSGRFESNGYTTVFIPDDKLKAGTIYTVTIKEGLSAANGLVALHEDYVFAFETSPDSKSTADPYPGYLSIDNTWIEFGTREKPAIPFNIHLQGNPDSVDVTLSVYEFETLNDFVKAIREKEKAPSWAPCALNNSMTDTSNIDKVLEFSHNFNLQVWNSRYMMFPKTLPHGFYLMELSCDGLVSQAFLQISDVASYTVSDKDKTLFWLNDINAGKAITDAEIYDYISEKASTTDINGLAQLPTIVTEDAGNGSRQLLYKVTTPDGKESIINSGYLYYGNYDYGPYDQQDLIWKYLQTDRTLYKPNDTVEFWGFIKSRIDGSTPQEVTVELSRGSFYYPMRGANSFFMPFMSNALDTLTLNTETGFFEGSIKLPSLDAGSYNLTVKDGDKIVASSYFRIENYIKPQYKLEIISDKDAIFTEEEISFNIKASFYDGTPVSNVPLRYSIYGSGNTKQGTGVTDINGLLNVKYTPTYNENMQGPGYFNINASAQFPETGSISEHYGFRVFANDITFKSEGDDKGSLTVTVNDVELDTLNDDNPDNDNYVGDPVSGHKASVKIDHIVWEKIETGTEYDAINKVVKKVYEYQEKRSTVANTLLKTGKDGIGRFHFQVDTDNEGYYIAEITTKDSQGRIMKGETYIYNTSALSKFVNPRVYDYYTLKADKESYKANETVNVQVLKNNEESVKDMPSLFIQARNGIYGYSVEDQPEFSLPFPQEYAPNFYLQGVVFNGKGYILTSANIPYDYNEKKLNLEITADKESYKPSDNMTINIKATNVNGDPVAAKVNLSMIDEALLELSEQYIDPLQELYSWIGSGIIKSSYNRDSSRGSNGTDDSATEEAVQGSAAPEASNKNLTGGMDNGSSKVRSDFKDTALFKTISLDENGCGFYTFKLPDNITSFRLTAAAVSSDLHAGSEIKSTKVSMPFFINDSMSLDYLIGDKPYIGLTAYGNDLIENEPVTFEVTIEEKADYKKLVTAKAFERIYADIPSLSEGTYNIVIKATSESGKSDAIRRTITVHTSFRTIETSVIDKLSAGMKIDAGKSGITTLVFSDIGKGSLINSLHGLAWQYGNRLDQKLVTNYARKLLKETINNEDYNIEPVEIEVSQYRNSDGAYGILPYAETDLRFTALITPLLKDITDTNSLKMYLYNELLSGNGVKAPALFALSELGEPVLIDVNKAAAIENLTLDDYIFIALSYESLGDYSKAEAIYNNKIKPHIEMKDPYCRIKVNNGDIDTSYGQTALTAYLASRIDSPDAEMLYNYVENNYSNTRYVGVEKVLYLNDRLKKLNDNPAAFDYSFLDIDTTRSVDLSNGRCEVIKVPSVNIDKLNIRKVTGDVSVLSLYTAPFTENVNNDPDITMTRKYYNCSTGEETTTFKANDIVKVEISYNIDKSAIDNTYEISDYAPAGLKPLSNPWRYGVGDSHGCWYRQFEGQKVTFVVGKSEKEPKPLVYYARIASPGEYTAEGTVAQGSMAKTSIETLENSRIVIEP